MGASTCMSNNQTSRLDKNGNPIASGTKSDWKNKKKTSKSKKKDKRDKRGNIDAELLESQDSNST